LFSASNALSLKNERSGGDLPDVWKFWAVNSRPSVFVEEFGSFLAVTATFQAICADLSEVSGSTSRK
jgi:hypothetical protein